MADMADLKRRLQEKSTTELQHSIMHGHLTEQASVIARTILEERGAPIPKAIPEEILEEQHKQARSKSNRRFLLEFLLAIAIICAWAAYGYLPGMTAESIASISGGFLGALAITGLISRLFLRKTGRSKKGVLKACAYTAAVSLAIASLSMGLRDSLIIYLPPLALWLVFDLIRSAPKAGNPCKSGKAEE